MFPNHNYNGEMASKRGPEFTVGGRVRCAQPDGRMRTATVAYVNNDDTVDLIYDSVEGGADGLAASNIADEEDGVAFGRLTVLQGTVAQVEAEALATGGGTGDGGIARAERAKDEAGVAFKLKDFEAAHGKYSEALSVLGSNQRVTVGSTVLIREKGKTKEFSFHYVPALVSIVDDDTQTVDVMYAEDGDAEEDGVEMARVYVLPPNTLEISAPLQCTLHLNCAVCALKLKHLSSAIEHASLAIAIAKFSRRKESAAGVARKSGDGAKVGLDVWVKGFFLRGKAQASLNHFKEARADARKILKLSGHEDNEQALKLLKTIDKKAEIALRKDKQLVKAVSKHISRSMDKSGSEGKNAGSAEGKYAHK